MVGRVLPLWGPSVHLAHGRRLSVCLCSPKSSPAAWEPLWTVPEVLCLFWAICSQPCQCFCLRFSTFCLHLHPFLVFASRWWCRKQPTLQTAAVIHWHHVAGVVPAASRSQTTPVTLEIFGQIARCTSPAWALQWPQCSPHPGNDMPTCALPHLLSPVFSWCATTPSLIAHPVFG